MCPRSEREGMPAEVRERQRMTGSARTEATIAAMTQAESFCSVESRRRHGVSSYTLAMLKIVSVYQEREAVYSSS